MHDLRILYPLIFFSFPFFEALLYHFATSVRDIAETKIIKSLLQGTAYYVHTRRG